MHGYMPSGWVSWIFLNPPLVFGLVWLFHKQGLATCMLLSGGLAFICSLFFTAIADQDGFIAFAIGFLGLIEGAIGGSISYWLVGKFKKK